MREIYSNSRKFETLGRNQRNIAKIKTGGVSRENKGINRKISPRET